MGAWGDSVVATPSGSAPGHPRTTADRSVSIAGTGSATTARVVRLRDSDRRARLKEYSPLITAPRWKLGLKRSIDVVVSVGLLTLLFPIMGLAAAAVWLSSPGPVLFRQERIGRNGTRFDMMKFRSMALGAEGRLGEVLDLNEQNGPVFKVRDDPRITRVGRLLRRTSIDEVPQLFHVLAGTMSLVGPRPALPREVEQYSMYTKQRLLAKPGLTCVWQVSGRSEIDFDTWVEMDLDYIEQWSLMFDVRLMMRTIPAVLSGTGAY